MADLKTEQNHLVQALTRLLRPLVRFLLSQGFTYTRLIQILRPLYVEIAEAEHLAGGKKKLTDSRISLKTGIARRYVKELRQGNTPARVEMLKSPPNTRLVAEWVTNKRFLSKDGLPLPLPRLSKDADQPGFEELAQSVTSDVKARTLLDDLIEKGLVIVDATDCVHIQDSAYKPNKNHNELIDYFGVHLHDHMSAATNNLHSELPPMFERSAFMGDLTEESIEKLKQFSDDEGMKVLKSVYAYAAELYQKDKNKADTTRRFRLGVYSFHEDEKKINHAQSLF